MKVLKSFLAKFKNSELPILYAMFGALLVCANCTATKQVSIGTWFGKPVGITIGILCYPFTFLITDIIGEKYGKEAASKAVIAGVIGQILAIVLIVIANKIPGNAALITDEQFNSVLGSTFIIIIFSLIACAVSQLWDVWVFHKIRDKYIEKHGSTKGGRWIWNNASTMSSQFIDSAIFEIAFIIIGAITWEVYFVTVFAYWVVKAGIALLDTPIFYLCTSKFKKDKMLENNDTKTE